MLSIIVRKKKGSFEGTCRGSDDQRLRILENFANGNYQLNEFIQSEAGFSCQDHHYSYCFLKSCHLCHKPLSLDREIYMYRGDLGFCSVECRNRQMYLDEMKKIEISTRRILASFHQRRRNGGSRCETRALGELEEYSSRRRHPFSSQSRSCIFS